MIGNMLLVESERVHVTLDLGDAVAEVVADVLRTDRQKSETTIAFREVSTAAHEAITSAIESMIELVRAAQSPSVLVFHPLAEMRAALERDLSRLQRRATLCGTLLETMWAIVDPTSNHSAVIIDADMAQRTSQLVAHFATNHSHVRRILLFGDQLGSVDRSISNRVDAVLRTPWRYRALARAIGIDAAESSLALLPAEPSE